MHFWFSFILFWLHLNLENVTDQTSKHVLLEILALFSLFILVKDVGSHLPFTMSKKKTHHSQSIVCWDAVFSHPPFKNVCQLNTRTWRRKLEVLIVKIPSTLSDPAMIEATEVLQQMEVPRASSLPSIWATHESWITLGRYFNGQKSSQKVPPLKQKLLGNPPFEPHHWQPNVHNSSVLWWTRCSSCSS